MKKILIVNGPNLNLLGTREPHIYGHSTLNDLLAGLQQHFEGQAQIETFQSNHEGALLDRLQAAMSEGVDGVVLNAGAYTHTSVALHDCIRSLPFPVVEVHISNVHAREPFRHHSMISAACLGVVAGFGLHSYHLAVEALLLHTAAQGS